LEVIGQRLEAGRAVLACRITDEDRWCRRCGEQGSVRDTVTRQLAHEPFGWRPTTLLVTIRRYRCGGCAHVWRQDTSKAAEPRAKLSRRGLRWALEAIVCQHLSVARVAEGLGVSWNTANNAVLAEGQRVLIADPARFDGVAVIGVDEHVWRHTRRGDKYVTVIIDLTPVRDKTGPARLLDMIEGRSKQAFQQWLADRPRQWRDRVEVVAIDGFSGFKTASTEELPDAVTVMDPFHVVRLAGNALDGAGAAFSWPPAGTAAARPTRCTDRGAPCTPAPTCSPIRRKPGWLPYSPSMPMPRSRPPGRCISAPWPPTESPTARKAAP
jgi:transposase